MVNDPQLQIITLAVTAALALLGYAITHTNSLKLKKLDAQYEFVTSQLRDLYGPLYALTQANTRTWRAFREEFRPGRKLFSPDDPMLEDEVKVWAYWVTHVFQPSNRRMKDVIERNAHLIVEQKLPECLLDFLAHADMFESVVASWTSGDYGKLFTAIPYPAEIDGYVAETYAKVSAAHARLGGRRIGHGFRAAPMNLVRGSKQ